jgi:hypothetical protein
MPTGDARDSINKITVTVCKYDILANNIINMYFNPRAMFNFFPLTTFCGCASLAFVIIAGKNSYYWR